MWELVDMVSLACLDDVLILLLKLSHGCSTSTRSTLVRRNMNLLDMAQVVDRLQYHYHHDGGAVWIGDDVAWTVERILGVYLRHYQWHIVAHTEGAGVVNHHSTILGDSIGKLLRSSTASRCECDIDIFKIIVMLQEFHLIVLSLIVVFSSSRTLRTKQHQLIHWEISLSKDTQEFLTYCTACTNNCYFHNRIFLKVV